MMFDYGPDERLLAFAAFRYCLGRRTYMVGVCADFLVRNAANFPPLDRQQYIYEIEQAIENEQAGMRCDIDAWRRARAALKAIDQGKETK